MRFKWGKIENYADSIVHINEFLSFFNFLGKQRLTEQTRSFDYLIWLLSSLQRLTVLRKYWPNVHKLTNVRNCRNKFHIRTWRLPIRSLAHKIRKKHDWSLYNAHAVREVEDDYTSSVLSSVPSALVRTRLISLACKIISPRKLYFCEVTFFHLYLKLFNIAACFSA